MHLNIGLQILKAGGNAVDVKMASILIKWALLKFYIEQSLRQDLAKLFSERVLEPTAEVLARHIQSEDKILTIIQEIQAETNI
jgi:hypothetical protein